MTEPAEPDFDVIVIGAGIAGCVTAYQLAQQGRSVLLIERGEEPGSKNLSGGVLYSRGMLVIRSPCGCPPSRGEPVGIATARRSGFLAGDGVGSTPVGSAVTPPAGGYAACRACVRVTGRRASARFR